MPRAEEQRRPADEERQLQHQADGQREGGHLSQTRQEEFPEHAGERRTTAETWRVGARKASQSRMQLRRSPERCYPRASSSSVGGV
eukprot:766248-Pleurochrysis_carterae.AAC.5